MLARAEDGERAIVARDRRTASAGLAFVARHCGVAEVNAAGALQQVSGNRRHVTDLRRSALQYRLRQHGIIALHFWVIREIRVACSSANLQSAIGHDFDLVERQSIDVEYTIGRLNIQLHEIDPVSY